MSELSAGSGNLRWYSGSQTPENANKHGFFAFLLDWRVPVLNLRYNLGCYPIVTRRYSIRLQMTANGSLSLA